MQIGAILLFSNELQQFDDLLLGCGELGFHFGKPSVRRLELSLSRVFPVHLPLQKIAAGSYNRVDLRQRIRAYAKGVLRRQADRFFPTRETRSYRIWIQRRISERQQYYRSEVPSGFFSILTAVWDGSPVQPLRALADSIAQQNYAGHAQPESPGGACEWVILDNGCIKPQVVALLNELSLRDGVKLVRADANAGITRGLRLCLEHATGRYVVPVDADDLLYSDALRVIASCALIAGSPPLLYTDEDKVIGSQVYQPYLKPDWDPVLLLNSAYIAHLGVMDRKIALELGVYSDAGTEGSPDWDAFLRFFRAGHRAVHIPEVVYSWRVHGQSTADDVATKPYVHSSQKAVLQRFLDGIPNGEKFEIETSPLFGGGAHWHLVRQHANPQPAVVTVRVGCDALRRAESLADIVQDALEQRAFLRFVGEDVEVQDEAWVWEALGLFEIHPNVVMIGGRISNRNGVIQDAGRYFGFGGVCGCPYRGRPASDPGYFGQLWKQRSVSAVSSQLAVIRPEFLLDLLATSKEHASVVYLGTWAGAHALRTGKSIVYSPFFSGVSDVDWDSLVMSGEVADFEAAHGDLIPDRRFYSRHFSLREPFQLELS